MKRAKGILGAASGDGLEMQWPAGVKGTAQRWTWWNASAVPASAGPAVEQFLPPRARASQEHVHYSTAVLARCLRERTGMDRPRDIEARVLTLAVATARWARRRPAAWIDRDLVRQFVRATTSVGANLEEARAAETKKDFVHKASVARKEALEAHYWARLLLADAKDDELAVLAGELNEVAAILTAIVKRSRESAQRGDPQQPPAS